MNKCRCRGSEHVSGCPMFGFGVLSLAEIRGIEMAGNVTESKADKRACKHCGTECIGSVPACVVKSLRAQLTTAWEALEQIKGGSRDPNGDYENDGVVARRIARLALTKLETVRETLEEPAVTGSKQKAR
jgi:hypothetical protein